MYEGVVAPSMGKGFQSWKYMQMSLGSSYIGKV